MIDPAGAAEVAVVVVVAPDKFRGSLTAAQAAEAMAHGLREAAAGRGVRLDLRVRPVADGGEGMVAAALTAGYHPHVRRVTGPSGSPVDATFAVSPDASTAIVELAAASGIRLLDHGGDTATSLTASTYGTGELVAAALDLGVHRVVIGLGGSASTDGGSGMAAALGARFLDRDGEVLPVGGGAVAHLGRVDLSSLDPRLAHVEVVAACDVDNPWTGPAGAATVFGPQKGAGPAEVAALDAGLRRLATVLRRDLGVDPDLLPGAGAAGGAGGGAVAFLGARLVPGIDVVLDLIGFDDALDGAHLVITGEGRLDGQSLAGKAPVGVARRAAARSVPVLFLAGQVDLDDDASAALAALGSVGVAALTDLTPDVAVAHRDAADLLRTLTVRTAIDLLEPLRKRSAP